MPLLDLGPEDWFKLVETVREEFRIPEFPVRSCFAQYGVCPVGAITNFSVELWNLYQITGGLTGVQTPGDYYALPALFVDACQTIEGELARIMEVRLKQDGHPQRENPAPHLGPK